MSQPLKHSCTCLRSPDLLLLSINIFSYLLTMTGYGDSLQCPPLSLRQMEYNAHYYSGNYNNNSLIHCVCLSLCRCPNWRYSQLNGAIMLKLSHDNINDALKWTRYDLTGQMDIQDNTAIQWLEIVSRTLSFVVLNHLIICTYPVCHH